MAGSGKRASMREGPLAALFRRTEEQDAEERPEEKRPPEREPDPRAEEPGPPVAATEAPSEPREPEVPQPRERLRHVFSPDIPENILDRGATTPAAEAPPRAADPDDVYAQPGGDVYGAPRRVG